MKEEINNTKGQRAIFCGSTLCGAGIRDGSKLVNFGSASRLIQLEPGHLHSLINNIEKICSCGPEIFFDCVQCLYY